jgi:hypothetical protein
MTKIWLNIKIVNALMTAMPTMAENAFQQV